MFKQTVALILLVLFCVSLVYGDEPELKSAFNGNDFEGWQEPKDNIWWSAKDGLLRVKSCPKKKGSTLWTDKEFTDFVVELDFKFGPGTVDSGVFIRDGREQIQIGISGSLKRDMTCSPYIAGKGYPVEAEGVKDLLKLDDWNTIRIKAIGKEYTAWLNGKQVMTYESASAVEKGRIGLQLHGNRDMQIDFRDIKIGEILSE
jgi:hypothetical protein